MATNSTAKHQWYALHTASFCREQTERRQSSERKEGMLPMAQVRSASDEFPEGENALAGGRDALQARRGPVSPVQDID